MRSSRTSTTSPSQAKAAPKVKTPVNAPKKQEKKAQDNGGQLDLFDNTDKKNGIYWVTDGAAKFIAKTDENSKYYNVGDTVRVLAIKGDLSNCYISGKYSQNADSDPLTYLSPTETVVGMTDNLIPSKIDAWGTKANGNERAGG